MLTLRNLFVSVKFIALVYKQNNKYNNIKAIYQIQRVNFRLPCIFLKGIVFDSAVPTTMSYRARVYLVMGR